MKTLCIDIETRPMLAHVWALWDQNIGINQIQETGTVICWAAKWIGSTKTIFRSDFHDGHENMIYKAWELMDEADAVVHYNGKAFDMKHLRREFLTLECGPPSPHTDIDLLSTVRSQFKFASNKLDFVAQQLGIGNKLQHNGFELWEGCIRGDKTSWAKMKRYNIQDVELTIKLYELLLPWIKGHPSRALIDGMTRSCPRCGSDSLISRGVWHTKTRTYRRWNCTACKGWCKSIESDKDAPRPEVQPV